MKQKLITLLEKEIELQSNFEGFDSTDTELVIEYLKHGTMPDPMTMAFDTIAYLQDIGISNFILEQENHLELLNQ